MMIMKCCSVGILLAVMVFLGLAAVSKVGCGIFAEEKWGMRVLADVPWVGNSEYITVPVEIDSKQYKFVIDTCCNNMLVGPSLKSALGDFLGTGQGNTVKGQFDVEFYKINNFRLGYLVLSGGAGYFDFGQLDLPAYLLDGIIGINLLDGRILHVDVENRRVLILQRRDSEKKGTPGGQEYPRQWGYPVPMTRNKYKLPQVRIRFGDEISELFMLDTGFPDYIALQRSTFEKLRDREGTKYFDDEHHGKRIEGIIVPEAFIGGGEMLDWTFLAGSRSILGMPFFKAFKTVTFDFEKNVLYLKPKDEGKKSD